MKKFTLYTFLIICLIPLLVMMISPGIDKNYENRPLARFPDRIDASFPESFQDYFSDNFGLRSTFISVASAIYMNLFADSYNEKVIIGKDGWLFFDQTADDYMGKSSLSEVDLHRLYRSLAIMSEYLSSQGIRFYIMPVPNKNSIYPEYMPQRYINNRKDGPSVLARLTEKLKDSDIAMIDITDAFDVIKDDILLYHKKDTHWNNLGAYIAHNAILKKLDMDYIPVSDISKETVKDHFGDLQKMLTPAFKILDDQVYIEHDHQYEYKSIFRTFDDMEIITSTSTSDKTLVMYKDSFANILIPYLSGRFKEARYYRYFPYDHSIISDHHPDVLIIQLAERNLLRLLYSPPIFPSIPISQAAVSKELIKADEMDFKVTNRSKHMIIEGSFSVGDDVSLVYLKTNIDDEAYYFEAVIIKNDDTDKIHFRSVIEEHLVPDDTSLLKVYYVH